jgi:CDP-diacylglycerol--serine O-phosphatidyltransferase
LRRADCRRPDGRRFAYVSGKDFNWRRRIPFAMLLLVPLGFIIVGSSPPEMLFGLFGLYALSGPLLWLWHRTKRGRRSVQRVGSNETH